MTIEKNNIKEYFNLDLKTSVFLLIMVLGLNAWTILSPSKHYSWEDSSFAVSTIWLLDNILSLIAINLMVKKTQIRITKLLIPITLSILFLPLASVFSDYYKFGVYITCFLIFIFRAYTIRTKQEKELPIE